MFTSHYPSKQTLEDVGYYRYCKSIYLKNNEIAFILRLYTAWRRNETTRALAQEVCYQASGKPLVIYAIFTFAYFYGQKRRTQDILMLYLNTMRTQRPLLMPIIILIITPHRILYLPHTRIAISQPVQKTLPRVRDKV